MFVCVCGNKSCGFDGFVILIWKSHLGFGFGKRQSKVKIKCLIIGKMCVVFINFYSL